MALSDLAQYAYGSDPMHLKVSFGNIDVTDYVAGISGLSKSLDYPNLTQYRQGEATVTMADPDGYFSDKRTDNFFADNSLTADGFAVAVEIETGYIVAGTVVSEVLFTGKITKIGQDGEEGLTDILVSDELNALLSKNVENIGVDRNFQLEIDADGGRNGNYPIYDFIGPIVDGSVNVKKDVNTDLNQVENLQNVGMFDSDNYQVTDDAILTEGGPVEGAATGYPQISMKSPHRFIDIETVIPLILTNLGITTQDIYVPPADAPANFSSDGRLGYDIVSTTQTGSSAAQGWYRYVTDILIEGINYYFLFSATRDDPAKTSYLIRHNYQTGVSTILHQTTPASPTFSGTELWKLAKDGDNIAILAADSQITGDANALPEYINTTPTDASYDASQPSSQTYILLYDESADTATTLVTKTDTLAPNLATYYILGDPRPILKDDTDEDYFRRSRSFSMFPDTRRRLVWYNNELYYAYFNRNNNQYGAAKVNLSGVGASLFALQWDGTNHAGISFIRKGTKLWVGHTRIDGGSSMVTVEDYDI